MAALLFDMETDKKKLIYSLLFPMLFVGLLWVIKAMEVWYQIDLGRYGIFPKHKEGLIGILTAPLIHENWSHLMANSGPLLILGGVLFYFYRSIAYRVFALIYLLTNIWVWCMAREAYHIGASGVVYGLATFVFTSGVLRKDTRLLALSFLVVFLYGSLVWGVFPQLFPEKNISWESHLMGIVSGLITAIYYRKTGPPRRVYSWELEDEEEIDETEPTEMEKLLGPPKITYTLREDNDKANTSPN